MQPSLTFPCWRRTAFLDKKIDVMDVWMSLMQHNRNSSPAPPIKQAFRQRHAPQTLVLCRATPTTSVILINLDLYPDTNLPVTLVKRHKMRPISILLVAIPFLATNVTAGSGSIVTCSAGCVAICTGCLAVGKWLGAGHLSGCHNAYHACTHACQHRYRHSSLVD